MRAGRVGVAVASAVAVLGGGIGASAAAGATTQPHGGRAVASCTPAALAPHLFQKGVLTVATDSPAYTPWFVGNRPANGKGYESAVAYAVAKQLGFSPAKVTWVVEPFDASYAPGPKKFDFDINEISYTPQRAKAVTFSISYYDVTQAIVAEKNNPIVKHHTPAELRTYHFGDQIGTTSLSFINQAINPKAAPLVYNTLNDVKSALQTKRIDAFVTDTPTAQYIASSEIPNTVVVGQFKSSQEHFGLLLSKGNPIVGCVNHALTNLRHNGTLAALQRRWLGIYNAIPMLKP